MNFQSDLFSGLPNDFYYQDFESGLTSQEVRLSRKKYGQNLLSENKISLAKILLNQVKSPLLFILFLAGGVSFVLAFYAAEEGHLLRELVEPMAILLVILLNILFGFWQDFNAEKTLSELKKLRPEKVRIVRSGKQQSISAEELVVGDLLVLQEGDAISADARLVESHGLRIDESSLTGESFPIEKGVQYEPSPEGTPLGDQREVVFSGTKILQGKGKAVIMSVGGDTEIGHIAKLLGEAVSPPTPLQIQLENFSWRLGMLVLAVCVIIFGISLAQERGFLESLFLGIAIAVAAIPEGLIAVMTLSFAIGVRIMAQKKALIRRLPAVETLGNITVIASDKTGTITENSMTVVAAYAYGREVDIDGGKSLPKSMLSIGVNCNDAALPNIGDPTEIALLKAVKNTQIETLERVDEEPFTSEAKYMSTTHIIDEERVIYYKGAPEMIAEFCEEESREAILNEARDFAERGLRTIAVAMKLEGGEKAHYQGVFGLQDPPRRTVASAIRQAENAGIRTIMITGDHVLTASSIARQVGIEGESITAQELDSMSEEELRERLPNIGVVARVRPEQKVRIAQALQELGEVVIMTGDGVNDAPALKTAQVGVSMGIAGTSVAREASSMILLDDRYATIVQGVAEGRRIYANFRKSLIFLLRTNIGEVLIIITALLFMLPLPLIPLHILLINLITDAFPALSLAAEDAEPDIMERKPRAQGERLLDGSMEAIFVLGSVTAVMVLSVYLMALGRYGSEELLLAQSYAFFTLVSVELGLVFSMRRDAPFWRVEEASHNPWVLRAVLLSAGVSFCFALPGLGSVFQLTMLPLEGWALVFGAGAVVFLIAECYKAFRWR